MGVDHRVSPLKKGDLQYRYADSGVGNDNPALRGTPDSAMLNRGQWYEVLYFVNKFANEYGNGSEGVAKKAERLIQKHLPSNQRSHEHVTSWLRNNWNVFGDAPI